MLKKVLQDLPDTYIMLDALDECAVAEHQLLLDFIELVSQWKNIRLHFLVTSQLQDPFTARLPLLAKQINLNNKNAMKDDITIFITNQLQTNHALKHWAPQEKEKIRTTLMRRGNDM